MIHQDWEWLGDLIGRMAELSPKREALIDLDSGIHYTYSDLNERANRLANYLAEQLGIQKGDRVAFISRNRVEMFDALFACGKLGAIFVPYNIRLTPGELTRLMENEEPKVLFYEDVFSPLVQELRESLPWLKHYAVLAETSEDGNIAYAGIMNYPNTKPRNCRGLELEDIYLLVHTGGTTGLPKGAMISHRAVLYNQAASTPVQLMEKFWHKGIKMCLGYGLTEGGPTNLCAPVKFMNFEELKLKHASVGKPFYFTLAKIVDEKGNEVGTGEAGELIFSGPQVFSGYWRNEEETRKTLRESDLIDYKNERARFMFNFADGAAACLLQRGYECNEVLETEMITDGSFATDVAVHGIGNVNYPQNFRLEQDFNEAEKAKAQGEQVFYYGLDVIDPASMKERLDAVSLENFVKVIRGAAEKSGYSAQSIQFLAPIFMKNSILHHVLSQFNMTPEQSFILKNFGHVQSADAYISLSMWVELNAQ
ncbi:hypothetical protein JCM15765_07840 [Paradesulfitobacterium aromaticivorans]